jgi:LacI family transcriptional regulator
MSVTIRDVAKAAGCSPMAVSKVLHGRGVTVRVGEEKAKEIRRIADELNYIPNQIARSLRGERRYNIGLVMDSLGPIAIGSRYLAHLYDGLQSACFEKGYSLTICPKLHADHKRFIADGRFDGIVWAKYQLDPETSRIADRVGLKIVHLHVPPSLAPDDKHDYFCADNKQALMLAVRHLYDLGHRRIDFGVDADNIGSAEDEDRWEAFQSACVELGLSPGKRVELFYTVKDAESWITDPTRGTGIVLRTENLASFIYPAAEKHGVRIPDDISIVGFDSTEFCDTLSPALTAINQPVRDLVYAAVNLLIRRIEGDEEATRTHLFPCSFDVRGSTAPPPAQ